MVGVCFAFLVLDIGIVFVVGLLLDVVGAGFVLVSAYTSALSFVHMVVLVAMVAVLFWGAAQVYAVFQQDIEGGATERSQGARARAAARFPHGSRVAGRRHFEGDRVVPAQLRAEQV